MKVLVIGFGSIARKHIAALRRIRPDVEINALRSTRDAAEEDGIRNVFEIGESPDPDFVLISNPTAMHAESIRAAVQLKKPLFIEKPPFHNLDDADATLKLVKEKKIITYTAFNLRFLDCLKELKKKVDADRVQEVNVYCGSYLPEWRKGADYKKSYSAEAGMGGGVHLDLIHELDYVQWIFGTPSDTKVTLRSSSFIGVHSIDYAHYTLIYDHFTINITLNYYRRDPKRSCEILMDDTTWNVNLLDNSITDLVKNEIVYKSEQTPQDTYGAQLAYFLDCIRSNKKPFNSLEESVNTLKLALP